MILTEYEAKQLLLKANLDVTAGPVITSESTSATLLTQQSFPCYVKAQVLHGNRGLLGLVKRANNLEELTTIVEELLKKNDNFGQRITQLAIEPALEFSESIYLSLSYDTSYRQLVVRYSPEGGEGMDERGDSVTVSPLSISLPPKEFGPRPELLPVLQQLWHVFTENDASLVEINPLVKTSAGKWVCLDAKIELESVAEFRHTEWAEYQQRSAMGRPPTQREAAALAVSRSDHRGAAGESFFEFPGGEIGVLAAGGGASALAMDALLAAGVRPANYTEHSGNPPREKVKALTDIILSMPDLKGLFVVGSNANFTDIYETMSGMIDSLLASPYAKQPNFALLVRRGGPRWEEAFAMIKERLANTSIKFELYGPDFSIINTATAMKKLLS
jgi:ATP-citrate lyase beta-subunit